MSQPLWVGMGKGSGHRAIREGGSLRLGLSTKWELSVGWFILKKHCFHLHGLLDSCFAGPPAPCHVLPPVSRCPRTASSGPAPKGPLPPHLPGGGGRGGAAGARRVEVGSGGAPEDGKMRLMKDVFRKKKCKRIFIS